MVSNSAPPHETCAVFDRLALEPDSIHRFVVGEDAEPRVLTSREAAEELGDPFATLVLLQQRFPRTAGETLSELAAGAGTSDPIAQPQFFLLGEGSQIELPPGDPPINRGLRFLVACGPDIILSAFHPDEGAVELMAWDRNVGGFNFYRTVARNSAWVFAGNSRHAVSGRSQGKGPFESHKSGAPLMKELRAPWNNWDSPDAQISPTILVDGQPLKANAWFDRRAPGGALTCEMDVIRPAIARWAEVRFRDLLTAGRVADPRSIAEQVLDTPSVNLVSSRTRSADATAVAQVGLPATFFVDVDAMKHLGLPEPPDVFEVPSAVYLRSLETFQVTLTDDNGFSRAGDTHFAFFVPERALEDHLVLVEALRIGLVTERLAAALLMTDFPNPTFSKRRAALLAHVPEGATLAGGTSDFSARFAEAILNAAAIEGSPESEFKTLWDAGEEWKSEFTPRLTRYYRALSKKLETQEGYDACFRLAESRRARVRAMPIFENLLLFPRVKGAAQDLAMREDGSVGDA